MKINSIYKEKRNIFRIINIQNNNFLPCTIYTVNENKKWYKPWTWFDSISKTSLDVLLEAKNNNDELKVYLQAIKEYFKLTYGDLSEYSNFKESIIKDVFYGRRNPSRELVIGLSFAFKLNIIESNLLLKAAGYNELYPRKKDDLIILKCIDDNKNIYETNEILEKYNCKHIGNLGD